MLPNLNLPPIQTKLKESSGKIWIFDGIRKKYVLLTPEEWVRQHFLNYLLTENYPKTLLKVEGGLSVNEMKKRSDIVVFNRKGEPWMVVECKNPLIKLDNATLQQVAFYNTRLRASFITVSNGINHFFFSTNWETLEVKQLESLPHFSDINMQ